MANIQTIKCFYCHTKTEPHGQDSDLCEDCARKEASAYAGECELLQGADVMAAQAQPGHWQDSADQESGPGDDTLPHRFFYR